MKRKFFIGLAVFTVSIANAQDLQWAEQYGNSTTQGAGASVTTDNNENLIVAYNFAGDPTFDLESFTSYGLTDGFISKQDSSGNLLWVKQVGGALYDFNNHIITDESGNIYVCGYFTSPVLDADPGPGTTPHLTNVSSFDIFIIKLDPDGNFIWATTLGGSGEDRPRQMDIDENGDLIIVGTFTDTVDFNPDSTVINNLFSTGPSGFILRLTSSGNFVSAAKLGNDLFTVKVASNGDIAVGGNFSGTVDLDPGPSVSNFTSTGPVNAFVCSLTNSNALVWANPLYGSNETMMKDLTWDHNNDIIITGTFNDSIQMDPLNSSVLHNTNGITDIYIIKLLGSNGEFIWGHQLGGTQNDQVRSIAADEDGYIYYIADFLDDTLDADPGSTTQLFTTNGATDYYISRLRSTDGELIWAQHFGSTSHDIAASICTGFQTFTICGFFMGQMDFDPGPDTTILDPMTTYGNAFVAKYSTGYPYMSIEEEYNEFSCSLYPNPATTTLYVKSEKPVYKYIITDLQGKTILNKNLAELQSFSIDISTISAGNYFISITTSNQSSVRKFIKIE